MTREPATARLLLDEPGRRLWAAGGEFWWDNDGHTPDEVELILWDRARRKDAKVERLRKIKARPELAEQRRRELIPDDVRVHVWGRDEGRCVGCGADEDLQFDHIIPVAKGGASSAANLQLLCGDCNRQKGDAIA
jgi:5-methylcytosine-specific restriction endonuclease McrA